MNNKKQYHSNSAHLCRVLISSQAYDSFLSDECIAEIIANQQATHLQKIKRIKSVSMLLVSMTVLSHLKTATDLLKQQLDALFNDVVCADDSRNFNEPVKAVPYLSFL